MNVPTRVHKNGQNSTCDQYFFVKLAPLDSAHIELSIHAKNSIFMKYPKWSLFSYQVILPHKKITGAQGVPDDPLPNIVYML